MLNEGTEIGGDFVVERPLGHGGMGMVYVALQRSTGRRRALKLMHPSLATDARARERFTHEAKVGALISSDHVVEVIAAGVDTVGAPWLAMELLDGEDLSCRLERSPLSLPEAAAIFRQTCHALAAAHAAGIVHRDLKPQNVFLSRVRSSTSDLTVKLLDFGIAKMVAEAQANSTAFIGTPAFMAPEQGHGQAVTPAADVWALGLMAFEALTGRSYWRAANAATPSPMQVIQEVATEPLEPATVRARSLGSDAALPDGFDAWLARCLARSPGDRFPTAKEAWEALAPLLGGEPDLGLALSDTLQSPALQQPAGSPRAAVLTVVGALLAICASVAWFELHDEAPAAASKAAAAVAAPFNPKDPALVWKIPVDGLPTRGPADALVTIVEFADFECPYSKEAVQVVERLLARHPADVRVVWRHYPINVHPNAMHASRVAQRALAEHGADGFWAAHDALFRASPSLGSNDLATLCQTLSVSQGLPPEAPGPSPLDDAIAADIAVGEGLAIEGIPTFFVNGKRFLGGTELQEGFDAQLEAAKARVATGVSRGALYDELTRGGVTHVPAAPKVKLTLPPELVAEGPTGAIEVVEVCDVTAVFCVLAAPAVQRVLARYPGKVRFAYWPVATELSDEGRLASAALEAVPAELKNKFRELVLASQYEATWGDRRELLDAPKLRELARQVGADVAAFDAALSGDAAKRAARMRGDARTARLGDATLFIDGERHEVWEPDLQLSAAIERAIHARKYVGIPR